MTDGSPLDTSDALAAGFSSRAKYAAARIGEAQQALALAGVQPSAISNLRLTDQRVSFCLTDLVFRILQALESQSPEIVLTHAYEGGHPDHDSVAFACHLAHALLRNRIRRKRDSRSLPRLMEFAAYHGENGAMQTYEFLAGTAHAEIQHHLTADDARLKMQMLAAFKSQAKTLQPFLPPRIEKYRNAPAYDFRCPPHAGKLFYEYFNWGTDGETWRELARAAVTKFNLPWRKSCAGSPS